MQIGDLDSESDTYRHDYHISVSKFCCPVCWKLIEVLNEMSTNIRFVVREQHPNQYPVCLPPWLSDDVLEAMISRFQKMLHEKFRELRGINEPPEFLRGHNKNLSVESAGETTSSAGTIVDEQTKTADYEVGHGLTRS
jgi:hypothetical protein